MKLTLINFRCYTKSVFHFPDNGTILLSGDSGIGKTTIFKAINFVLFDKESKVITYGEKKCEVILEYNDVVISRRKNPNYLTYKRNSAFSNVSGAFYENDVAQNKIKELFGNNFLLTGYMPQKNSDRFFLMSNNEKTSFLQSLSIKNFDIDALRKKMKDDIKTRKDKLMIKSTETSFLLDSCKSNNINENTVLIEPKTKTPIVSIEENTNNMNHYKNKLKMKRVVLDETNDIFNKNDKLKETIKSKQDLLNHFQKDLVSLESQYLDFSSKKKEDDENSLKADIVYCQHNIKLIKLKKLFKDTKEEYDSMVVSESEKIKKEIEKNNKSIDECNQYILKDDERTVLKKYLDCVSRYNNLKADIKQEHLHIILDTVSPNELTDILNRLLIECKKCIEDIENDIETMNGCINTEQKIINDEEINYKEIVKSKEDCKDKYKCPKCNTGLMVRHGKIEEATDAYRTSTDLSYEENISVNNLKKYKTNLQVYKKEMIVLTDKLNNTNIKNKLINKFINQLSDITIEYSTDTNNKTRERLDTDIKYSSRISIYKNELIILEKNICLLKSNNTPLEYLSKKRLNLVSIKKNYDELKNNSMTSSGEGVVTIEEYEDNILTNNVKLSDIKNINIELKRIDKEINEKTKSMDDCLCFLKNNVDMMKDEDILKKELSDIKQSIEKYENNIEKLIKKEKSIKKYNDYMEVYTQKKSLINKLGIVKIEESVCIRNLSKAEELLKYINDAESMSLYQTIQNINNELDEFITAFFGDKFSVSLNAFKEMKDGDKKTLIDVQITKDGEIVPLDGLSGGEYDRVSLALFLSFNKSSSCNLVLLDECLASLHSELVEDIVELIKTKMSNKIVMFTLHQANTGIFDHTIDICQYRCS